jgi:predicted RND superfamily exporter protein
VVLLILSTLLVLIFYYRVQVVTSFLLSLIYVVVSLVNSFGSKVKELKELLVISKYLIPR